MRSSKPPALATWLVEHLIPGDRSEALAGDLLEQFSRGRSAAWYWRQALIAIAVGFSKKLHILSVAAGFTVVWISVLAASKQGLQGLLRSHPLQTALHWGWTLAWPLSGIFFIAFVTAFEVVPILVVSLTTYLLATRNLGLRRFAQGLLMGLVGFALGVIPWTLLPSRVHGLSTFSGYLVDSLPLFFALLLSIWTVRPNNTARASAKISV